MKQRQDLLIISFENEWQDDKNFFNEFSSFIFSFLVFKHLSIFGFIHFLNLFNASCNITIFIYKIFENL